MKITLMGTGTSSGIPAIACHCSVCTSKDQKDKRLRTSAYIIGSDGTSIVIDTGPDFREQALKYNLEKLDAILLTHAHADHVHGLDDIRVFSNSFQCVNSCPHIENRKNNYSHARPALKIYSNTQTIDDVKSRFSYFFMPTQLGGGKPRVELVDAKEKTFSIGCLNITPVPILHGDLRVCGWKINDIESNKTFAYLTDCNFISEGSINLVKNVDCAVIDGLRKKPHPTHCCFEETYNYAQKIEAKNTWITHISHAHSHIDIINYFEHKEKKDYQESKKTPYKCLPAWDGQVIEL